MHRLFPSLRNLCLVLLCLGAARSGALADVSAQLESTVRILCPKPAKTGNGLEAYQIKLPNGEVVIDYSYSLGTGFVINHEGYVVTNNHVVAEDALSDKPNQLILVVQKTGDRYTMHRAKPEWLSPNRDIAIVHCPDLNAKPLPLRFLESSENDEVVSMGFPGVSDLAVEDQDQVKRITAQIIEKRFYIERAKLEQQWKRKLTDEETQKLIRIVQEDTPRWSAEMNMFFTAIDGVLTRGEANANSWDITDVVSKKTLWKGYFKPTVTRGNIERIAQTRGFLGSGNDNIGIVQHSCDIRHGNSGGPLLNAAGHVIAVVGRGMNEVSSGDKENVKWAIQIGEIKDWLNTHKVGFQDAANGRYSKFQLFLISFGLAALMVGAGGAGYTIYRRRAALPASPSQRTFVAVESIPPAPIPLPPIHHPPTEINTVWEMEVSSPDGFSQRVRLESADFRRARGRVIIGRSGEFSQVQLKHDSISRQHLHLELREDGGLVISDRNSSNGTKVNGTRLSRPFHGQSLREGDQLQFGGLTARLRRAF